MQTVSSGSRVIGIAGNWSNCILLKACCPSATSLSREINRGWLAASKREDPACVEQSQTDAWKHLYLGYLCFGTIG